MNKEKKIYKYIKSTLPVAFFIISGVHASSMEEEIKNLQPKNPHFLTDEKKLQDERLEQLFNENREAMEQAKKRAKRRLKIDVPKKQYTKK